MGLFDKINAARAKVDETKARVDAVREQVSNAKQNITQAVDVATGKADMRPYMPQPMLSHLQNECVKVYGTQYHQTELSKLHENTVNVTIAPRKSKEWDSYPVTLADGSLIGALYAEQLEKAGIKKGSTVTAEIVFPVYQLQDIISVYVPMTDEQLTHKKEMDSLKLWVNLDGEKWQGDMSERLDYSDVEVFEKNANGKKPVYVIMGDGKKLFEVTPRMKMHDEIESRAAYKPRRLIAERKDGTMGAFYRIGFYY